MVQTEKESRNIGSFSTYGGLQPEAAKNRCYSISSTCFTIRGIMKKLTSVKAFVKYLISYARSGWNPRNCPIQVASSNGIRKYESIARDFLKQVFYIDYDSCFISDESSVFDFLSSVCDNCRNGEDYAIARDKVYKRIKQSYGVDVSDIADGNLIAVFERILQSQEQI